MTLSLRLLTAGGLPVPQQPTGPGPNVGGLCLTGQVFEHVAQHLCGRRCSRRVSTSRPAVSAGLCYARCRGGRARAGCTAGVVGVEVINHVATPVVTTSNESHLLGTSRRMCGEMCGEISGELRSIQGVEL